MLTNNPFADILQVIHEQQELDFHLPCSLENKMEVSGLSSVGGVADLYGWLVGCQENSEASLSEVHICIFASSYKKGPGSAATVGFVAAASKGLAPVNRLCVDHGIGLRVLEMAPEVPHDIEEDWSELDCTRAVAFGMEAGAAGGDLLGLSDMAPGNLAGALAVIACCITDGRAWLDTLSADAAAEALNLLARQGELDLTPLEALRLFGGREAAGCLGAFLAARSRHVPVVIDGWAAITAYAVLKAIRTEGVSHVRLAACENATQRAATDLLGMQALVGADIDAGAGCGAAVSVSVLKAAIDVIAVT